MELEFWVPFLAIVAVIIVPVLVIVNLKARKRTKDMETVSYKIGFSFAPKGESSIFSELSHFPLFSQGHSKWVRNVLGRRDSDVRITILDYKYTVGYGRNSRTYKQTVVYFQSDNLALPDFALRPESIFHKFGSAFGYQDIDFEINPEFSRHYLLRGTDETAIRNLFSMDVLDYFEREKTKKMCVEGSGKHLICYRTGKLIKPEDIRIGLEEAKSNLDLFRGK